MNADPEPKKKYIAFILEFIYLGHIEQVPKTELVNLNCYYLPHHCVHKPDSTTTKLRVVFDASKRTTSGHSLNDCLLVGPKLQDDLFNNLVRFRYFKIAMSADISTGGGILLIHRKDISISVIQNPCNQDFEIVTCRVLSLNYLIIFICCYRPPSGNLKLFLEEFHGLLVKFSSEYILCCGDFNIHVNRICPASTDFKDILDEFGLVQSVELPTHKNGNTLDLVIEPQKFEICLVSVSTSDHNWLNFDCLKQLLENRERSVVKFRNWKNVDLVDFNEDCFYHLWSIEGSPLVDSFL